MKTIYEELSEERKSLQDAGLLPDWFTTAGWQLFSSKYTTETEKDYKSVITRISKCAASWTDDPEQWEKKFFDIIWKGWYSCATPVLANMGTERGCNVSCSGNVVPDEVYGFYESQKEMAVLSKNGFGTSSYLGNIRSRGSAVSSGGKASGVLPVLKDFVQVSRDISQGNCYHPSVEVLTDRGFMTFQDALESGVNVFQISEEGHIGFVEPEWVVQDYSGKLVHFSGEGIDIKVTPNHRMYYRNTLKTDKFSVIEAENLPDNGILFKTIRSKWDVKIISTIEKLIEDSNLTIDYFDWNKKNVLYNMPALSNEKSVYDVPYLSNNKEHVDIIQAISSLCGVDCRVEEIIDKDFGGYALQYFERNYIPMSTIKKDFVEYTGKVYCAVVPYGGLMVRSNGNTLICGNTRRGAWAGYIEIDHEDFWEIVNFVSTNPDDCNIGWIVSDNFIERLKDGDKKALSRYQRAMKIKMVTGKGYFFFVDKVNRLNPPVYKEQGLEVKASNLCVTGDTFIHIKIGKNDEVFDVPIKIIDILVDNNIPILVKSFNTESNEIEWKRITNAKMTKQGAKIIKITDSETGKYIKCTPCHLVYTKNRGYIEAGKLLPNDELEIL